MNKTNKETRVILLKDLDAAIKHNEALLTTTPLDFHKDAEELRTQLAQMKDARIAIAKPDPKATTDLLRNRFTLNNEALHKNDAATLKEAIEQSDKLLLEIGDNPFVMESELYKQTNKQIIAMSDLLEKLVNG